jgi:hypothetical protein
MQSMPSCPGAGRKRTGFYLPLPISIPSFFLGYLLHGVQDLASHQGVTNSQHAYESYIQCRNGVDCDHLEANRQTARQFTTFGQLLVAV